MPKSALPEINISSGNMVEKARQLIEVRAKIAELQTQEKDLKKVLGDDAETTRKNKAAKNEFIGLIRVTGEELPPVRVEFRQAVKPLDVSQEQLLDQMYGPSRPLLFEKQKIVTQITNPSQAIKDLESKGLNPWDCLEIRVKENMDRTVADSTNSVVTADGLVPKKGFIATLSEIAGTLTQKSLDYTRRFLEQTLSAVVVAGTKGKA